MKHRVALALMTLVSLSNLSQAQDTLDALQKDLNSFKQERQQANDQSLSSFLDQVNTAAQGTDAAMDLYKLATGQTQAPTQNLDPNTPPPFISQIDYSVLQANFEPKRETPKKTNRNHDTSLDQPTSDERQAMEQEKEATTTAFANMVQAHCALLHFAALFTCKADTPGLQQEFLNWLNGVGMNYPQLGHSLLGQITMRDSPISRYLDFQLWNRSEQSQWSIRSLPKIYYDQVLQPLSTAKNPQVLNAWDTYMAMRQSDEPDQQTWTNETYPDLMFQRGCDDFALAPSTTKLANLVAILKSCPNHPRFNEMMSKVNELITAFKANPTAQKAAVPAPTVPSP